MLSLKAAVVPLPLLAYTAPLNTHKTLIPWNCGNDPFILRSSSPPIQQKCLRWVVPNRVPLDQYPTDDSEESDASDYEDQWASYTDSEEQSPTDSTTTTTTTTTYATTHGHGQQNGFEELVKEVELLLEPEEKAILETNKAPVLSKISSIKWSPFHTLTVAGQIGFMDKLLEHGFDIDSVDKDGFTALHLAVLSKKESIISHLLRKGANPHVRDRDGATPLHYAAQVGAMQTVKLLIKYKVDVNVADEEGWTPLHVAIQARCRDIAKVLLVNGADKTRRNKDGKLPLDLSLCYGKDFKSYELAKLLKLVPANRDP